MTQNPYIGPRFFREEEQDYFFGRDEETHILLGLVQARRVVLLFAKSGVGKSSLLRAGLTPKLTETKTVRRGRRTHTQPALMQVLPVTTVGGGIRAEASLSQHNPFVLSLLSSLYPERAPESLASLSLTEGLADLLDPTTDQPTLLIIDQFEELFTRHVSQWQAREPFFEQINQALTDYPTLHVLFAMREDYIAELTPYADLLQDRLQTQFRLERLNRDNALKAITHPAEQAGRSFADGVAENLVDNLRGMKHEELGIRNEELETKNTLSHATSFSEYIEAVHLQVVCRQLWAQLPAEQTVIEQAHVQAFGDVDKALTQFYEDSLQAVLQATNVTERHLRNWFSDKLITPNQTRGLVYRGETDTDGLPNEAVEILSSHWLIRADKRGGDTWYELAHDRLVGPIGGANRDWRNIRLKSDPLLRTAYLWYSQNKPSDLLYQGKLLTNALTRTDLSELGIEVQQFLKASVEAKQRQDIIHLRELDKLKTEFIADLSLELRTPLNSIIGFSRIILKGIDGPITELQKADLTSIHNSAQHVLGLINNMLDLYKIQSGKLKLDFEKIEIGTIIEQVISVASTLIKNKPIQLINKVEAKLPPVWADPIRIRQILLNLVSNAYKFTDKGTIEIDSLVTEEKLVISIKDTGIGIPTKKLNLVFEEFTHINPRKTREVGGTGLGLPISRYLVEAHKGQIIVESEENSGSVFSFSIPTKKDFYLNLTKPKLNNKPLIIVVDANSNIDNLYSKFLGDYYDLMIMNNIDNFKKSLNDYTPAAILLDIVLPNIDGWTVLDDLQKDLAFKNVPIVVCTTLKNKDKGITMGVADYLIKPIVKNELLLSLNNVIQFTS